MTFVHRLSEGFMAGGIWMWAILACQIFSIAIIIERVIALYIKRQPNQLKKVHTFEKPIKAGKLDLVLNAFQSLKSNEPIDQVALVGSQAAQNFGGKDEIQLKIDEVLIENNQKLERNVGFLSMLANVSTLIGLLGTILGMIDSFSSLSAASAAERSTLLAHGISMAMNATAYGLIVAVPSLVAFSILQNRSQYLMEDLNKAAMKVFIWLTYSFEAVPGVGSTDQKK